jgi:ADYC domain
LRRVGPLDDGIWDASDERCNASGRGATTGAEEQPLMPDLKKFAVATILLALIDGCGVSSSVEARKGVASDPEIDDPDPILDPITGCAITVDEPTCPVWGCGTNSPTMGDGSVFDELDSSGYHPGEPNVQILSAVREGHPVTLKVNRHFLSVIDDTGIEYSGPDLVGTIITVLGRQIDGRARTKHELLIAAVDQQSLHFWSGDIREPVPFYNILTRPLGDPCEFHTPICKMNLIAKEPVWNSSMHSAIAFAGDRYDPVAKTVEIVGKDSPWFNLACAGTAPAKMHLMRHTSAGASVGSSATPYWTTGEERQAMLKMFAADYCGTGDAYTGDGQPLRYGDANHWYPATPVISATGASSGDVEALWTAGGAACVDTPRRVDRMNVPCLVGSGALPPCTGLGGVLGSSAGASSWEANFHVISVNAP